MAVKTYSSKVPSAAHVANLDVDSYVQGYPKTTDAAPTDIVFKGMAPYASATGSNRTPGNVWLAGAAPSNGGSTYGKTGLRVGADDFVWATNDGGIRKLQFASGAFITDNRYYHKMSFVADNGSMIFTATNSIEFGGLAGGGLMAQFENGFLALYNNTKLGFQGDGITQTTVGAAGGASALPATPLGYLTARVNGTEVSVPYYTKA